MNYLLLLETVKYYDKLISSLISNARLFKNKPDVTDVYPFSSITSVLMFVFFFTMYPILSLCLLLFWSEKIGWLVLSHGIAWNLLLAPPKAADILNNDF